MTWCSRIVLFLTSIIIVFCGIGSDKQLLIIEMIGADVAPEGATGTANPVSIELLPVSVTMLNPGTGEIIALSAGVDFSLLKIIDRTQIIFEQEIQDYVDTTFSSLTINIEETFTVNSRDFDAQEGTFTNTAIVYEPPFEIETGKDISFQVQLSWRNIVSETGVELPSFTFEKL